MTQIPRLKDDQRKYWNDQVLESECHCKRAGEKGKDSNPGRQAEVVAASAAGRPRQTACAHPGEATGQACPDEKLDKAVRPVDELCDKLDKHPHPRNSATRASMMGLNADILKAIKDLSDMDVDIDLEPDDFKDI